MASSTPTSAAPSITSAVIHPLVLLSVVDHHNRVAEGTQRRVIGVLLGSTSKDGVCDVVNCYASESTFVFLLKKGEKKSQKSVPLLFQMCFALQVELTALSGVERGFVSFTHAFFSQFSLCSSV